MKDFLTREGYAELAKRVNSAGAAITTVFLFTRLWARQTHHKGLWWDDYLLIGTWVFQLTGNGLAAAAPSYGFNILTGTGHGWAFVFSSISCFYIAMGLGKAAFASTLLRLSEGKTKVVLWFIMALVTVFQIAVTIVTWLDICDTGASIAHLSGKCLPLGSVLWIHIGAAIVTVCADAALAYLPWIIISKVYLPKKEKWSVAITMSLVGLAGPVCLARLAIARYAQEIEIRDGRFDWSYGAITIWALLQAEVVIYVVAQTIPLLRVMIVHGPGKDSKHSESEADIPSTGRGDRGKTPAAGLDSIQEVRGSMELVQLPGGKIVAADSEEGKAFKASQGGVLAGGPTGTAGPAPSGGQPAQRGSGVTVDDEIHRIWADMGLSRRAWSKSPSPPPEELRRRSMRSSGPA